MWNHSVSPVAQLISSWPLLLAPVNSQSSYLGKTGRKYGDGLGRISLPQAGTKFQNLALAKVLFPWNVGLFMEKALAYITRILFLSLWQRYIFFFFRLLLQKPGRVMREKPMKVLGVSLRLQPLGVFKMLTFEGFLPVHGPNKQILAIILDFLVSLDFINNNW